MFTTTPILSLFFTSWHLVEDIWNSIIAVPDALEITDEERRLIDERLEAFHRDPQAGSPWEEVRARISSRTK